MYALFFVMYIRNSVGANNKSKNFALALLLFIWATWRSVWLRAAELRSWDWIYGKVSDLPEPCQYEARQTYTSLPQSASYSDNSWLISLRRWWYTIYITAPGHAKESERKIIFDCWTEKLMPNKEIRDLCFEIHPSVKVSVIFYPLLLQQPVHIHVLAPKRIKVYNRVCRPGTIGPFLDMVSVVDTK